VQHALKIDWQGATGVGNKVSSEKFHIERHGIARCKRWNSQMEEMEFPDER
jgi:hypothetical protein